MSEKFKLSEENERQVQVYAEKINDYESALEVLSRRIKEARTQLWDVIESEYPQVRDKNINATYHHDTKDLIISTKYIKSREQHHMEQVVKEMVKDGVEEIITQKIEEKFNQE
jgi:hypothetical protein